MRSLLVLLVVVAAQSAAVTAQDLVYAGWASFSSGSYIFTEPTRTLSVHNGLTFTIGRLRLGAGLPVILQNSGALTRVGGAYLPTGGSDHGAVGGRQHGQQVPMGPGGAGKPATAGGPRHASLANSVAEASEPGDSVVQEPGSYDWSLGDPLVSSGVELYRGYGALRTLELTAAVKPPLNGLGSGVGTGEWDYGLGGAAAAALGPVLAFLDVAYWWYGDLPELELRNGPSWGGGLGAPLSRSIWVSAMATSTNRIIESAEAVRTASLGFGYRVADAGFLSLTAGVGLTETSPDYTLSLGWRRNLLGVR